MELDTVLRRNFSQMTDQYRTFAKAKDACRSCSIYSHYEHVGQSEGNPNGPTFMFVGEALGADEVVHGRPFIGKAGQRLRDELRKHAKTFNKTNTLISNVLSCRPLNNRFPEANDQFQILDGKRKNKTVKGREVVNFCATKWVREEIKLVKPKVIITLGAKSLDYLRGDSGITANRGSWKFLEPYRAWSLATYHPSYVIRCQNDDDKAYIVHQFEDDISKIAKTWSTIVNSDQRMSMSQAEWERDKSLTSVPGVLGSIARSVDWSSIERND